MSDSIQTTNDAINKQQRINQLKEWFAQIIEGLEKDCITDLEININTSTDSVNKDGYVNHFYTGFNDINISYYNHETARKEHERVFKVIK